MTSLQLSSSGCKLMAAKTPGRQSGSTPCRSGPELSSPGIVESSPETVWEVRHAGQDPAPGHRPTTATFGEAEEVATFEKRADRARGPRPVARGGQDAARRRPAASGRAPGRGAGVERHRRCAAAARGGAARAATRSFPLPLRRRASLASPRFHRCRCQARTGPATVSPLQALIPDHVAPERLYLEARWASLVPYAAAAGLLADVLPIVSDQRHHRPRSTRCGSPSVPRPNSARSGPASSTAARRTGPSCRPRKVASWSGSTAAMSATGREDQQFRGHRRPLGAGGSRRRATSAWCTATTASPSVGCSTC